jgi:hypothetical protein
MPKCGENNQANQRNVNENKAKNNMAKWRNQPSVNGENLKMSAIIIIWRKQNRSGIMI